MALKLDWLFVRSARWRLHRRWIVLTDIDHLMSGGRHNRSIIQQDCFSIRINAMWCVWITNWLDLCQYEKIWIHTPAWSNAIKFAAALEKIQFLHFNVKLKSPAVSLSGCYWSVWIQASQTLGAFAGELLTRGSIHCKLFASASDGAPAPRNSW